MTRCWNRCAAATGLVMVAGCGCSRPRRTPIPALGSRLRALRVPCTIPERKDQQARRAAQGSAVGRPRAFDPAMYKKRDTIERGFNRTKQCHGIATRYDKYATTYLGGVLLNAAITYHRTH